MTRVYYKEAVGAFVVFDVTRVSTFEAVSKWKHDLDSKVKLANGSPIPSVLLANKCDQKKDNSNNTTLMDNFCKETGFLGWFETSAKVRNLHKPQVLFFLQHCPTYFDAQTSEDLHLLQRWRMAAHHRWFDMVSVDNDWCWSPELWGVKRSRL